MGLHLPELGGGQRRGLEQHRVGHANLADIVKIAAPVQSRHVFSVEAKRLTLPGEMGERFKVIGLQRGVDASEQFAFGDQSHRL